MGEKILIRPIELRNQRPTEINDCFIELFEDHLRWKVSFHADEPVIDNDVDSGWEQVYNDYDIIVMKEKISGVEKSFTKDKKWGVYIIVSGFANDVKVYSKSQTTAQQLFDKIHNWLISIPETK